MYVPDPVHKQWMIHGLDYITNPYSIVQVIMIMDTHKFNILHGACVCVCVCVCVRERESEREREREREMCTLLILAYISSSKTPLLVAVEDLEVGGRFSDSLSSCVHGQQANVQWM